MGETGANLHISHHGSKSKKLKDSKLRCYCYTSLELNCIQTSAFSSLRHGCVGAAPLRGEWIAPVF
jgi:hypothetical protein